MTELERQLTQAASQPQLYGAPDVGVDAATGDAAIAENLFVIHAELDAPQEALLARLLRRLGVPDLTVPLVTATPALRRSWFVAIAVAVLFALSAATNNGTTGVERITVFLTLAPLMPLLGVALAFGKGVDPTHDLVVAAPRDTFTVFLIRALTVLAASSTLLLVSSLLLPTGGLYRVAWLMPALAITASALALAAYVDARRAAVALAVAWLVVVIAVTSASSASTMFGPATQLVSVLVAGIAVACLVTRRARFDGLGAI